MKNEEFRKRATFVQTFGMRFALRKNTNDKKLWHTNHSFLFCNPIYANIKIKNAPPFISKRRRTAIINY